MIPAPRVFRDVALRRHGKLNGYPTEDMCVGDSFFVPLNNRRPESATSAVYAATRRAEKRYPQGHKDFIVRRVREHGVEGVRCWRIK